MKPFVAWVERCDSKGSGPTPLPFLLQWAWDHAGGETWKRGQNPDLVIVEPLQWAWEPSGTEARPGSAAKIAVLAARVERGESLWHELDNVSPPRPKDLLTERRNIKRRRRRLAEVA